MRRKKAPKLTAREKFVLTAFLIILVFLNLAAPILFPGCLGPGIIRETGLTPGMYEGSGRGYRGPINVRLQISTAGIEDITITSHAESAYPGAAAMEELLEMILDTGLTDLDAISGATSSSRGFLEAVEDALGQAGGQESRTQN